MNNKLFPFHLYVSKNTKIRFGDWKYFRIDDLIAQKLGIRSPSVEESENRRGPNKLSILIDNLSKFKFAQLTSTLHTNANGIIPIAAMKIINDKLTTGNHEYADIIIKNDIIVYFTYGHHFI